MLTRKWTTWAGYGALLLLIGWVLLALASSVGLPEPFQAPGDEVRSDRLARLFLLTVSWLVRVVGLFMVAVGAVLLALQTAGLYDPEPVRRRAHSRLPDQGSADGGEPHAEILAALDEGPADLDELVRRTGLYPVVLRRSMLALVGQGRVIEEAGTYRRVPAPERPEA